MSFAISLGYCQPDASCGLDAPTDEACDAAGVFQYLPGILPVGLGNLMGTEGARSAERPTSPKHCPQATRSAEVRQPTDHLPGPTRANPVATSWCGTAPQITELVHYPLRW